jgi:hypothetical protein
LPFKLTNVPELLNANQKWTDEYVASHFDTKGYSTERAVKDTTIPAQGKTQESSSNFFIFFQAQYWNVLKLGIPPTRNNDFTYKEWAEHARYADLVGLQANQPHYYWQAGVPREEREHTVEDEEEEEEMELTSTENSKSKLRHHHPRNHQTFISQDLPSFSSPNSTFISSSPEEQKGIQCRFGERGIVAAGHYDGGQNMVGMIAGAKRYILFPPNQCPHLGINTDHRSPLFRHSILNFGNTPEDSTISDKERQWLQHSTEQALAIETVLKEGEVLFIPSYWFHYIVGLQKNVQCNVRSGVVDTNPFSEIFGDATSVTPEECVPAISP